MSRCQFWLKVASEILTGANVVTRVGELADASRKQHGGAFWDLGFDDTDEKLR